MSYSITLQISLQDAKESLVCSMYLSPSGFFILHWYLLNLSFFHSWYSASQWCLSVFISDRNVLWIWMSTKRSVDEQPACNQRGYVTDDCADFKCGQASIYSNLAWIRSFLKLRVDFFIKTCSLMYWTRPQLNPKTLVYKV